MTAAVEAAVTAPAESPVGVVHAAGPPTAPAPVARGVTRQDVFSVLGALGAVLTLVTGLMYYFGWRRSAVQAQLMGVDVSMFGFSTQDYVLRSISSLFVPILVAVSSVLAVLFLHVRLLQLVEERVLGRADRCRRAAMAAQAVAVAGIVTAASCVLFDVGTGMDPRPRLVRTLAAHLERHQWVVPMLLVLATLAAAHAGWLRRRLLPPTARPPGPLWSSVVGVVLVAATVALGTFWMLEQYAASVGRTDAMALAAGVDHLPRAVALSPTPLGLGAPGVSEQRTGAGTGVRYRTTGLRLLARSGGKILLVNDGWDPASGTVIVLPDSDELSWQFSH